MTAVNIGSIRLSSLERIYAALSPCVFGTSLLASYFGGARSDELRARTGWVTPAAGTSIWLHGASAGEMAAASRLVTVLRGHGCRFQAILTAANRAGVAYISRWDSPDTMAALAPWDVPAWVSRAFDRWRPAALFLIETELWPRLVFEAYRRRVPVLALSARIYPRDLPRYRAIRGFIAPTLQRISRVLAQNETERDRFIALGADASRCVAAGNLKHLEERAAGDSECLRRELELNPADRVIVFGSIHRGEITTVLEAAQVLAPGGARLVIAPRHMSAAPMIAREAAARGLETVRRSQGRSGNRWQVLVLDSMGELRHFYAIAAASVIGGGFGRFGGHNPFEALQAGAPVLLGPHFDHFEHEARALAGITPEVRVSSGDQIAGRLRGWLNDERARQRILSLQRMTLPDAAAIARRYFDELSPFLAAAHA
ncbi:MAG: 3-deoxy-D-manno-octulosonic acid transferase [Candidatus Binataceae bacterium]